MKKLLKQLEKRGFNNSRLSEDGIEVRGLIEDDYIQIELSENGYIYLTTENSDMQVDNNLNSILEGLNDLADE